MHLACNFLVVLIYICIPFISYFHSHASFVVHFADQEKNSKDILGCFYIKPNFPGRCSHVCNGGFITNPKYRGLGIGGFMGEAFKTLGEMRSMNYVTFISLII